MIHRPMTIVRLKTILASLLTLLLLFAAQVFAHGDFEHVGGTVVKMENSVLTVKTTRGNVAIRLDAKTQITQSGKPAQAADLKQGVKVVVDVPAADKKDSKEKVAHSVKIAAAAAAKAAPAAAAHAHDGHK